MMDPPAADKQSVTNAISNGKLLVERLESLDETIADFLDDNNYMYIHTKPEKYSYFNTWDCRRTLAVIITQDFLFTKYEHLMIVREYLDMLSREVRNDYGVLQSGTGTAPEVAGKWRDWAAVEGSLGFEVPLGSLASEELEGVCRGAWDGFRTQLRNSLAGSRSDTYMWYKLKKVGSVLMAIYSAELDSLREHVIEKHLKCD